MDKKTKKLLSGLESSSLDVQRKSAMALLEIKEQIMENLSDSFENLNIPGKRNLVVVLGKIDDERSVNFLINLLSHKDPVIVQKAIHSLLALGKNVVAIPLLKAMAGEDRNFYKQALKVLDEMDLEDIPKEKQIYYYIARGKYDKCLEVGDPAVGPLIAELEKNKDDQDKKRTIAVALGKLKSNKAIPHLLELLAEEDKYVRERAIEALGIIGDKSVGKHLIPMLQDSNFWVRKITAEMLENLGWVPEDDTEKAHYHLAKKNYEKCIEIGEPAVEGLIKLLSHIDEYDPEQKKEIIHVLGEIGDMRSCNAIIESMKYGDQSVRETAITALKSLGPVASSIILKELSETSDDKIKEPLIKVLGDIGDEQSAITLIELLQAEKDRIKSVIAMALGNIKCREAVNPLIEIIHDKSVKRELLESAVIALGEIGDTRAVYPLSELMADSQYMMSKLKSLAAQSLGKIGDDRAVEILKGYTKDKTCYPSAIEALGKINSPEALDILYKIITDEEEGTLESKISAVKALEATGGEEIQAILYAVLEQAKNEKLRRAIIKSLNNLGIPVSESQPKQYKKSKLKIRR